MGDTPFKECPDLKPDLKLDVSLLNYATSNIQHDNILVQQISEEILKKAHKIIVKKTTSEIGIQTDETPELIRSFSGQFFRSCQLIS